jgi:DNA polymerase III delta prime subunit
MFYVDKYIPKNINDIFFHEKIYELLEIMANDDSVPHLLFHGPPGCGKKTMVNIFMQLLFGETINTVRNVSYNISGSGNMVTVEDFAQSFHHIFIEPKGNNHDRYLIHDVIKVYVGRASYNIIKSKHNFKLVVINNVDIMSESVQFSLRRTIEQYSDQCRFIIISNSISKVIDPLASRCLCINVKSPNINNIIDYTFHISRLENITITIDKLSYIISKYNGNIKNVLWILQIFKINENYINNITDCFDRLKILFEKINIIFDYEHLLNDIKKHNDDNMFIYKSINKFVNKIGYSLYDFIINNIKQYLPTQTFNMHYNNPQNFINTITKTNFKTIKYQNAEKKIKIDDILFKIKNIYYDLIIHIRLLSPILTSEYAIYRLYKYVKTGDLKNINNIRNIIFNLLITNISGTNIIKLLLNEIINDEKLSQYKKIKIINVSKDAEYGIIKGRREINQFDNLLVSIINIITS